MTRREWQATGAGAFGTLLVLGLVAAARPRPVPVPMPQSVRATPAYRVGFDPEEQPDEPLQQRRPANVTRNSRSYVRESDRQVARTNYRPRVTTTVDAEPDLPVVISNDPNGTVFSADMQRVPDSRVYMAPVPTRVASSAAPLTSPPVGSTDLAPVEVVDGTGFPSDNQPVCENCHQAGEGICDCVQRSKGCDREPCPCPTDEVLSYYRCNYYGYYPTFWRPWPGGWLKYRPIVNITPYDRFRKPSGPDGGAQAPIDPNLDANIGPGDVDLRVQDLLKDSGKSPIRTERKQPDLLPEEDMPSAPKPPTQTKPATPKTGKGAPPPMLDSSEYRGRRDRMARPVGHLDPADASFPGAPAQGPVSRTYRRVVGGN